MSEPLAILFAVLLIVASAMALAVAANKRQEERDRQRKKMQKAAAQQAALEKQKLSTESSPTIEVKAPLSVDGKEVNQQQDAPPSGEEITNAEEATDAFVKYMKSLGHTSATSIWCAMHAVPDAFKDEICPMFKLNPRALEKTLKAMVPAEMQEAQFKITGDQWSHLGPDGDLDYSWSIAKVDVVDYEATTIPDSGNMYIHVDQQLPGELFILAEKCVVFVRVPGLCGGKWIHDGPNVSPLHFNKIKLPVENHRIAVTLPDQPEDTEIVEAFLCKAAPGCFGEIGIQFAPPNPMCDPYPPETIKYSVVSETSIAFNAKKI